MAKRTFDVSINGADPLSMALQPASENRMVLPTLEGMIARSAPDRDVNQMNILFQTGSNVHDNIMTVLRR